MRALLALCLLAGCPGVVVSNKVQHLGVTGLWTDPNPHTDVPEGALKRAEEVVFRRKGVVEPRPGFQALDGFEDVDRVYGILPFDGDYITVGRPAVSDSTAWSTETTIQTEDGDGLEWDPNAIRAQGARKNLYLTTSDAVRKVSAAEDDTAYRAGIGIPVVSKYSNTDGVAVDAESRVAYRALFRKTDANGVIVRGGPSGRLLYENDSGSADQVTLRVWWSDHLGIAEGDVVELYRTRNSVVTPSDEMFLAYEVELTSTDISNGYVAIVDNRDDDDLLAALYTNSSREGIERANVPPPKCTDLALYQGSLFASRIKYPHRMFLKWEEGIDGDIDVTSSATGIGLRTANGDLTDESNEITNVDNVTGLQVGMLVRYAGSMGSFATGPVYITAIDGDTVTINTTWEAANEASANLAFWDAVVVVGSETWRGTSASAQHLVAQMAADDPQIEGIDLRTVAANDVFGYVVGNSAESLPASLGYGAVRRVVIERFLPSQGGFTVYATHGNEFTPPLPLPGVGDGEASSQDDFPNAVTWSKQDQPEHFMNAVRWYVGREDVPVLRIFGTRTALWILKGKGDGIYRLTGFGERSGFRVDQFDATTYLLHPKLAVQFGDAVYAWTSIGAVMITDAGVVRLSDSPIGSDFTYLQSTLDHDTGLDGDGLVGAYAVVNEKDSEIIWGLPGEDSDDYEGSTINASRTYVFNTETKAWARWFVEAPIFSAAAYNPETRKLLLGLGESGNTRVERGAGDQTGSLPVDVAAFNCDLFQQATLVSTVGNVVTIEEGATWTPEVGDVIARNDPSTGFIAIVTDVTSATVFTVNDGSDIGDVGLLNCHKAFTSVLEWVTKTAKAPAQVKRFHDIVTHWEDTHGIRDWSMTYAPLTYGAEATGSYTRSYAREEDAAADTRVFVPRDAVLGSRLGLTLEIRQADARWRLAGLTLGLSDAGMRLAR